VLVKDQYNPWENGIYVWNDEGLGSGYLMRDQDFREDRITMAGYSLIVVEGDCHESTIWAGYHEFLAEVTDLTFMRFTSVGPSVPSGVSLTYDTDGPGYTIHVPAHSGFEVMETEDL
jgi:hypothetical protein